MGYMLYDLDYSIQRTLNPCFWGLGVRDGVLDVRNCEGGAMILQALVEYYEALRRKEKITSPGWCRARSWRTG